MVAEKYYSVTETAVLVREALKNNFPGVKFSVRSSSYAGGASIDVRWTLGPTVKEVDSVVRVYQSESFDGSIDMACYKDHWMTPDGQVSIRSTPGTQGSMGYIPAQDNPAPEGAVPVHFGSHYVQTARREAETWQGEISFREQVAQALCALQHVEWSGENTMHLFGDGDTEQVTQHAWRLINQTSFKPGEEYAGVRYATDEERNSEGWDTGNVFVILKKAGPVPETGPVPHDVKIVGGVTIRENQKLGGIELLFQVKPPAAILAKLKENGWRWSHVHELWYNKISPENMKFAENLLPAEAVSSVAETKVV